jgi:putative phage-type endonuclease
MNHQQWLAERRKGVGASDIHQVLALEPYGCPRRLFLEKINFPPDYEAEDKAIFRRGKMMEPIILQLLAEEHLDLNIKASADSRQGSVSHHRASPDGFAYEITGAGAGMVIESKTAGERAWRKMIADGLPESYIVQLQWSMHVCGVQHGIFAVLWPDAWKFRSWIVERNQAMIDDIVERVDAFWERVKRTKLHDTMEQAPLAFPPGDARCQRCIYRTSCQGKALLEASEGRGDLQRNDLVMLTGPEARKIESIAERFIALRELASEATDMLEAAKVELKAELGERTAVEVKGARIYNRPVISRRVDMNALKQKYKDVYEAVAKDSISQPLRVFGI